MGQSVIEMSALTKTYDLGDVQVNALRGIDLHIQAGEFVAIMGASGSGKSTLMNIIGCLDVPSSGFYFLNGVDVAQLSVNELADIRNISIGFVFQGFNLLARTSALDNVELPLFYNREKEISNARERSIAALETVGLGDRIYHLPNQLSGGQQQRVAIARAIVNEPAILLADEPTGNLDSATSQDVMNVFTDLNKNGMTIILVTHESDIATYANRTVTLKDGTIISDVMKSEAPI